MNCHAAFIWFVVSIFSVKYMDHEENVNKFYAYTVLTLSFMIGLAYAGKKALDTTQVKVKCQNCGKVHYMSKEGYNNL